MISKLSNRSLHCNLRPWSFNKPASTTSTSLSLCFLSILLFKPFILFCSNSSANSKNWSGTWISPWVLYCRDSVTSSVPGCFVSEHKIPQGITTMLSISSILWRQLLTRDHTALLVYKLSLKYFFAFCSTLLTAHAATKRTFPFPTSSICLT